MGYSLWSHKKSDITECLTLFHLSNAMGLPRYLRGKEPNNAGDTASISGSGRSPGERNVNPLQYSCLGNPMDRGVCQAIVLGVTKQSDKT